MTTDPKLTRALDLWLAEGHDEVNDHVLDLVEGRIRRERQRPAWLLRRSLTMRRNLTYGVAAAAALVVAVVGYNLLTRQDGVGGPTTPLPTASPTAIPTGSPVATGPVDLPDGTLAPGQYRIRPLPDDPDLGNLTLIATVPAGGWQGFRDVPALIGPRGDNDNAVLIGFMAAETLFSDPCHWDLDGSGDRGQPGDIALGPDALALVNELNNNPGYTYLRSEPYKIDGFDAWDVELQLPGAEVLASCDSSPEAGGHDFLVFGGGFWAQGADNRWRLAIIDVDGSLLVALVSYFNGTSALHVSAGQAIVQSFEITP
jgi:hypothetical protein